MGGDMDFSKVSIPFLTRRHELIHSIFLADGAGR